MKKICNIILMLTMLNFIACNNKEIKINFEELKIEDTKTENMVITSIGATEKTDLYEYNIRIPRILLNNNENTHINELNTKIDNYINGIVNRLKELSNEKNLKDKPSLNVDYEIYYGHKIYTIVLVLTQNINEKKLINKRFFYIDENGKYTNNIDDKLDVDAAFPYLMEKIKSEVNDSLLFDFQQAIMYFKENSFIVEFPEYSFSNDDLSNYPSTFEFKEDEISKFLKNE